MRQTFVIHSRLSWRHVRGAAAVKRQHGLQAIAIEHLAARLAGGFLQPIDSDSLKEAIGKAIAVDLGEFNKIKTLPGFSRAAATTLAKAWAAGLKFPEFADTPDALVRARIEAVIRLEAHALERLPPSMRRPADLVDLAVQRLHHAKALFGAICVLGRTEMSPVWRPLLAALKDVTDVQWIAGPRRVPAWVRELGIAVVEMAPEHPEIQSESCASPRHEALEAMRWVRALIAAGQAKPEEIAIAAASPSEWDDHFQALGEMAGIDLHFVHGRKALSTPEGQFAAALAEVLLRGFSQARMTRLIALLRSQNPDFKIVPGNWWHSLPQDAPLLDAASWRDVLPGMSNPADANSEAVILALANLIETLAFGLKRAGEIGNILLHGRSLAIWERALTEGPPEALDVMLASLTLPDQVAQEANIIWAPAASLAADPRPWVRLVGLTSRAWPRHQAEDALLPNHIVESSLLDPLPVHQADRRDFDTILKTTARQVVCSRARRDTQGRINGISPLYPRGPKEIYRQRARVPEHAAGWSDRLFARPEEFEGFPVARAARSCWVDWHTERLTAHDGLVKANHPLVVAALNRRQSATSLAKLLRDPLGYLWTYGFRWQEPDETEEPLQLDASAIGGILHAVLERAVSGLELANPGGFGTADSASIVGAVERALDTVEREWKRTRPVPPPVIWERKLDDIQALAIAALGYHEQSLAGQRSWAEIPFGGDRGAEDISAERRALLPWDPMTGVVIPETTVAIGGSIDRLDLDGGATIARVTDYKSGKAPRKSKPLILKGGAELQRCLYAYAVRSLVPSAKNVQTRLLYPRAEDDGLYPLADPEAVLASLAGFVTTAQRYARTGNLLPGAGAQDEYNDLSFALPGGAKESYFEQKSSLVRERLADLSPLWEME
ncbi:MAG: PD-(D/E)XK nuclease family protein [Rhizomicrobium sp.]